MKEQEREAKLGEREQAELRSSNQYLLERLEQVTLSRTTEQTIHSTLTLFNKQFFAQCFLVNSLVATHLAKLSN